MPRILPFKDPEPEEINGFFKVTHYRSEYFEKVLEHEKEVYKKNQEKK